jgi:hypothetical protein
MTDREAMKQALEALEAHADIGIKSDKAIDSLRQAIEQAEKREPVAWMNVKEDMTYLNRYEKDDIPLYMHPIPPKQEPVAWAHPQALGQDFIAYSVQVSSEQIPLYTAPPNLQKAAEHWHGLYLAKCRELHDERARLGQQICDLEHNLEHSESPKPEWVGLTDEELTKIADRFLLPVGDHWVSELAISERHVEDFAKAISAKLKEKNHG